MKIILTNPNQRKTFDSYNILKKYYKPSDFLVLHTKSETTFLNNIYNNAKLFLVNHNKLESLIALTKLYDNLVFIPLEEEWIEIVLDNFEKLNKNLKFYLPDKKSFHMSRNKVMLSNWCENNSISSPKKIIKFEKNEQVVLKPAIGSGSRGVIMTNSSKIDFTNINFNKFLVQEKIPNSNKVLGGFYYAKNGKVISFYSHERIRTYPKKGGVTLYSISSYNKKILNEGRNIIKKLNWNGFIMIEFILDVRDNKLKLIEINPRLWGSILLSEFSGNHMLYNYVQSCLSLETIEDKFLEKKIRWLFPFEYLHLVSNPINPINFIVSDKDTCYVNYTYSDFFSNIFLKIIQIKNFLFK